MSERISGDVSIQDFLRPGETDYSLAAQRATDNGQPVYWPDGVYVVAQGVSHTGKVIWYAHGGATIQSDDIVLTVSGGTGSRISGLHMENITPPWIISRNSTDWSFSGPTQSNEAGYQPTSNDVDVWSTLTLEQQNQQIGPTILFKDAASDIEVSGITGRFVTIQLSDAQNSVVRDCRFRAGKNFGGGINFWNVMGIAGTNNRAINNYVEYASNSGIQMAGQMDGIIQGNSVAWVGESGIKTGQGTINTIDARCYRMQIQDNHSSFAYYDGFDLSSDYPHTGLSDSRHIITGNAAFGPRQTGFFSDGNHNLFSNNQVQDAGATGIALTCNDSLIAMNQVHNANTENAPTGAHQMSVGGNGNTISGNLFKQKVEHGHALYADGNNFCCGNYADDATLFFGNPGAITATLIGNQDSSIYASVTQPQRFNQAAADVPAIKVHSEDISLDHVDIAFHPRSSVLHNPVARLSGAVTYGVSGAENGWLIGSAAQGGSLFPGFAIQTDNTIPGKAWFAAYAPDTVIPASYLQPGTVAMSLDESADQLVFSVKYANGVTKTGKIALI